MEETSASFSLIYSKVITQSMNSGNDGVIAECCKAFFTRSSKHHAEEHLGPVTSVKVWCRLNEVRDLYSLINYCKKEKLKELPKINERHCSGFMKLKEQEIEYLKSRLLEKRCKVDELLVYFCN